MFALIIPLVATNGMIQPIHDPTDTSVYSHRDYMYIYCPVLLATTLLHDQTKNYDACQVSYVCVAIALTERCTLDLGLRVGP